MKTLLSQKAKEEAITNRAEREKWIFIPEINGPSKSNGLPRSLTYRLPTVSFEFHTNLSGAIKIF